MSEARKLLRTLFDAAVDSAMPENCMRRWMPQQPNGRIIVVGAGKAAASMAAILEDEWRCPLQGQVIVPYGHGVDCTSINVIEAAHPVPDEAGLLATKAILDLVSDLSADDTVVCLISGGGSSLLCLPAAGVSLAEKQAITSALLNAGAAIHEINCVRKKLSAIKGGKLAAAAAPAKVMTLIISDVPGNDAATVASGPTVADTGSASEALEILQRYGIAISDNVSNAIKNSKILKPVPGDMRILATSDDALLASAALAVEHGVMPYSLGDLSGDAATLGAAHAELAMQIAAGNGPLEPPCVILSGGETTVNVRGNGRGGRNGEYALSLAIALNGHGSIHALSCDTDGIDGSGDNAGYFVSPSTLARAEKICVDATTSLADNNSYNFFKSLGDLIITGPTRTNVNDFRAIYVARDKE